MKSDDIMFLGHYGNEAHVVRITKYWSDTYNVFVAKLLVGRIMKRNDLWFGDFNKNTLYTHDDVLVLSELIDNHEW